MAKNQIVTDYDDAGFPQLAATTAPVTAGGLSTVKAGAGRLLKVVVTTVTAGAAITIFDNASAASGTALLVIPIGATPGTIYDVNLPAANGITVQSTGATGALTVGFA